LDREGRTRNDFTGIRSGFILVGEAESPNFRAKNKRARLNRIMCRSLFTNRRRESFKLRQKARKRRVARNKDGGRFLRSRIKTRRKCFLNVETKFFRVGNDNPTSVNIPKMTRRAVSIFDTSG